MSAASISSSASSALDFLRLKPQKAQSGAAPTDDADATESPNADLLRMIQGLAKPRATKEQPQASNNIDGLFAQIQLNGKTIATIQGGGANDDGRDADLATQPTTDLAPAANDKTIRANGAVAEAQWAASQADKPGAVVDPVQQEKQRSYSGLQERSMIANPSMLVQAQLFAQQNFGFDAKSALSYVPPLNDRMSAGGTTA